MANRRPVLIGPDGAVVFAPSESADQTTPWTSPIIKLATRTGQRIVQLSLDASDNLTVKEVDLALNPVGLGTIVSAVNVPVSTQLAFRVGPTNLSAKYLNPSGSAQGSGAAGQVSTQTGQSGDDVFVFVNGNTGVNQPERAFAGTSVEVGEGVGSQTGN